MVKKINIFLVLLLLILSISAVSAAADSDMMSGNETISDSSYYSDGILSSDVEDNELLTAGSHIVTSSNYNNYFSSKGQLISSAVNAGDTLKIDGSFSGKEFKFDKAVNVVGTSTNDMKNCVFTFYNSASGSTISNLKIANTQDGKYGIFLNNASNCIIQGCIINNTGMSSYDICIANQANYNNVSNNVLTSYGITYGHGTRSTPSLLLSDAHHNYIGDNVITCDDANAIYLSSYSGGPLTGGESNFNTIHNNVITYNVLPTSWGYGIQVMGGNNTISSNRIIGAYRGVSTMASGNIIIDNWIINLTGADFNNPGVPSGGEIAIVGSSNSIIKNNHIINAKVISTGAGITALDNSIVENNHVEVSLQGKGIHPKGSNIIIKNNTISTDSGSGILYNIKAFNLEVLDNNISSKTGIGVLIQKEKDKKLPGNITIVGNSISTDNKYAIDAAEANASSVNIIGPNNIKRGCMVKTPEGSYDPSKPVYNFNGTVHNINPSNYGDYINDNGGLSSDIKDGDILNFTGKFYDKVIFINSAIKITGDNPTFYNTTFRVECDSVWIENLVIRNNKASRLNAWGVLVYNVAGATVTNCDIEVFDPNAAYAIYVVESTDVDVINNRLFSSGDYLTYTLLVYAAEYCKFENNYIGTLGTGVVHQFENQNCLDGDTNCLDGDTNCLDGSSIGNGNHMLSEVYRTYGLIMAYSSNNNISGNMVNVTSKLTEDISIYNSTNSIVGIHSHFNCKNNVFSDNEIYIKANDNYIYGMSVLGYSTGKNVPEGQGAINNQFINNRLDLNGKYVYGIVFSNSNNNSVITNKIFANGTGEQINFNNFNSKACNAGIFLKLNSKNNAIKKNSITSQKNYAILVDDEAINNIITDNCLDSEKGIGNAGVNNTKNNIVENNYRYTFTGKMSKVIGTYLETSEIKLNIDDGAIVKFYIDGVEIGSAVSSNGAATLNYKFMDPFVPNKNYKVKAVASKENYLTEEFTSSYFKINKGNLNIVLNDVSAKKLTNGTFAAILRDVSGNAVSGITVKFYMFQNNTYIGETTTNSNGIAMIEVELPSISEGNYLISANAADNNKNKKFNDAGAQATLNIVNDSIEIKKDAIIIAPDVSVVYKDTTGELVANIINVYGKALAVNVDVSLNGKTYTVRADSKGQISIPIGVLAPGSYVATISYKGNGNYNPSSATANVVVIKADTVIVASDVSVVYRDPSGELVATITNVYGKALAVNVDVSLNGETYIVKADSKGQISIPIGVLAPGSYVATISYKGNMNYNPTTITTNVIVTKADTIITAPGTSVKYKDTTNRTIGTITNIYGKALGVYVTVKLKGVNYYVRANSKGQISISTSNLAPGKYTATITYAGNGNYNPTTKTAEITVNKANIWKSIRCIR